MLHSKESNILLMSRLVFRKASLNSASSRARAVLRHPCNSAPENGSFLAPSLANTHHSHSLHVVSNFCTSLVRRVFSTTTSSTDEDVTDEIISDDEDYFIGSSTKPEPWKTLLQIPARAAWRVASPHSDTPLDKARQSVLDEGSRSNKQLHKSYCDKVVDVHRELLGRRERERLRILRSREYKPREIKKDAAIQPVLYGPDETLAAFKFRLLSNYAIAFRVLDEASSLLGPNKWRPKRVIDFGIGCGSAAAAAMEVWDDIEWVHGIDSSQAMREGAQLFLEDFIKHQGRENGPVRVTLSGHLSVEVAPPSFDLALFSYTAMELSHSAGILAAAGSLWEKLLPGGILVMIEPGTPDGFSSVRIVRNMLLECCPPNQSQAGGDECHIIAPCTHNGPCPMERYQELVDERRTQQDVPEPSVDPVSPGRKGKDKSGELEGREDVDENDGIRTGFCSFVQTMPGASWNSKGEKFSYLVAQKRLTGESLDEPHPFADDDLLALLERTHRSPNDVQTFQAAIDLEERYIDSEDDTLGLELLRGDRARASFGRIVNAPKKKKGHVYIETCTAPGRLDRHKVRKSLSKIVPGIYAAARKSRWGGFFPDSEFTREKKGN